MEINKVQWRMIAKGAKLPCDSFLMKKDGTMTSMVTGAGVTVGQDAYYLPVEELRSFPKEESEGERIRKDIVEAVELHKDFTQGRKEHIYAWLKKQGEQKPAAWSEEDEFLCRQIEGILSVCRTKSLLSFDLYKKMLDLLKSLKDRVQPQPKKEWNEEDDEHLERILKELESQRQRPFNRPYLDKIESDYNWLKSLRPQSQWKPSGKQLEALKEACDEHWEPDGLDVLYTLYQDLKKLKE